MLELARLWLNKARKLFRLDAEYCRDLRWSIGVAEASDSQMLVWSDCDVRDLLNAGSWGTVPGMSKCGRVGDVVMVGVVGVVVVTGGTGEVIVVSVMGVVVQLIAVGGPL